MCWIYTTTQNFGHTFSFSVFFIFIIFKLYFNTEDIQTMKEHTWNYVVNKKVLNNSEYVLYFRLSKVYIYFDDRHTNDIL